jgi:hypothetical protein
METSGADLERELHILLIHFQTLENFIIIFGAFHPFHGLVFAVLGKHPGIIALVADNFMVILHNFHKGLASTAFGPKFCVRTCAVKGSVTFRKDHVTLCNILHEILEFLLENIQHLSHHIIKPPCP